LPPSISSSERPLPLPDPAVEVHAPLAEPEADPLAEPDAEPLA
jgi:hypothetical protein